MRRNDREITGRDELLRVIKACDVCRLALNDVEYPYLLPLNFGVEEGEKITLYFHGAREGYKYRLIGRDARASFEMDCAHRLVLDEEKGACTMEYESVIGRGIVEFVEDEAEKMRALRLIMAHYGREEFGFRKEVALITRVMKLTVEHMTGKRRMKGR